MKILLAVVAALVVDGTLAFYSPSSGVVNLTSSNFQRNVVRGDEIWIINFYALWCRHCQKLVPEYQKAAKALKGVVKVGGVNADEHMSLALRKYGVKGFPTIKIFGLDKNKPEDYNGQRSAQGIVDAGMKAVREKVNAQFKLSDKKSGSCGSGGRGNADDVVELTDSNFEKLVLKSDDMWLVEFFAPWRASCRKFAPLWQEAASKLKGKFKLGVVNVAVRTVMESRYEVNVYPTIIFFNKGKVEEYDGGTSSLSHIVSWANDKVATNVEPPEIV
ncbi:hypothetical protein Pmani_024836 [Petrolisthes manimaculis]|uniref:Thioredoxin domain-containing protein n=1 Tax=Petrolisthes manimaculis TaxID=1843537 RepID=A0AAE1TZR8_9EUCA|nr:hypothetical protein Pmani_024836 [Petrolisthes manimaculis]